MLRKLFISTFLFCCLFLGVGIFLLEKDWVDFSTLDAYKTTRPSIVLDDEGNVLARFSLEKRTPVSYDKIPDILIKAFVAAEDHNFFQHIGISFKGIVRSFLINLYHRRIVQGASTITQQLARGMFLSFERTWYRKIQEVFLAFQIERKLSKEQILELYLNNIYLGRGIYGIQAACKRFWDKPLSKLTIGQTATLAAVAKSAFLYSPLNAPENAQRRRNFILRSMYKLNFITEEQYEKSVQTQLQIQDHTPGNPIRLYLQEWIRMWAENKWGKDTLYRQGLHIKTTINKNMQKQAELVFKKKINNLRNQIGNQLNGGMLSIEPHTGQIKAIIGGYNFKQSQFNRATQAYRQMGSTFKPILYALAMKAGIEMDTTSIDEPIEIPLDNGDVWKPKNWNNLYEGKMTLVRAITLSKNTITAKLFLKLGASYVIPWVKFFGIHRQLTKYPSTALGTAETTVEENAAAFNVFANNGVYVKPYLIEWVKNKQGKKIWQAQPNNHRVLDSKLNSKMVNLLSWRMIFAEKREQNGWIDCESIGKTGSTNGASTTWFVGSTPFLTTAIYLGCDDNTPMGNRLLAGRTTFPIWLDFYKKLSATKKHFYIDPTLQEVPINWITGEPSIKKNGRHIVTILK